MVSSRKKLKYTTQLKSGAFSYEEDEIFVELVAQHPDLYDSRLESFKDGFKKDNVWKRIGSVLNKTSDDCKKRWKYIKDSYNRYKRKKQAGIGSAAPHKTSKWQFYEKLKFLELSSSTKKSLPQENQIEFIDIVCKEEYDSEENDNSEDNDILSTIVNEPENEIAPKENTDNTEKEPKENSDNTEKAAPKTRRPNKHNKFKQYMRKRDAQRQKLIKRKCTEKIEKIFEEDDVNSFGEHIKSVLMKLPPIIKVKAKAEIFNVMSKYELMAVETT